MLIKTRNFSLAGKREKDWNAPGSGGLGWNPDYVMKFRGSNMKSELAKRNTNRAYGVCTECKFFQDVDKADGSHCKKKERCDE